MNPAFPIPILVEVVTLRARTFALLVAAFGGLYGAAMGLFEPSTDRWLQPLISAVKVPLLVLVSFALSVPSFYVINALLGLREDFRPAIRAIVQAQASFCMVILSLAPVTLLWYVSVPDYKLAVAFNGMVFAIGSLAAQLVLRRLYRPLVQRNPRHRSMLVLWAGLFAFTSIQMAWVLRPFVGNPREPVRFIREEAWGNAYVEVWNLLVRIAGG
jgi:hypothetical protein